MIFKAFIVAAAILNGVSAEGQYPKNTERQLSNASTRPKNHSALTLQGFLSFLDDDATNLRGQGKHRRLERIVGTEGESMTKQEVKEAIQRAIDPPNGGRGAYENCEQLFNAFDKNKDGYLTKSEMADLFSSLTGCSRSFGLQLAQGMLDWYDSSGDDKLNPAELEAACKGDPHFVTWYGRHFSYHGACDLVLVHNPAFALGKGLDLHVRTAHMLNGAYSFVSNAALRIGDDVLEVASDGSYFINGMNNVDLPTMVGGFAVSESSEQVCKGKEGDKCSQVITFSVSLMDNDNIRIRVASNMIHVDVKGSDKSFNGSSGLMGTYPSEHHGKIARDGQTYLSDPNIFAQEWQVLSHEPKLFHESRYPQHPQLCIPAVQPSNVERRLQGNDDEARLLAEEACAHVEGPEWEFCIFDVMATGDYGMAATIYGSN